MYKRLYVQPAFFGPHCKELPKGFLYYLARITAENEHSYGGYFIPIYEDDLKVKKDKRKHPIVPGGLPKLHIERVENDTN